MSEKANTDLVEVRAYGDGMSDPRSFWPTSEWVEAQLALREHLDKYESACCRARVVSPGYFSLRCCGCGKRCVVVDREQMKQP